MSFGSLRIRRCKKDFFPLQFSGGVTETEDGIALGFDVIARGGLFNTLPCGFGNAKGEKNRGEAERALDDSIHQGECTASGAER